ADTARHIWIRAGDDTGRVDVRSGIAGPASGRRDRLERRIRRNGLSKYSIDGIEGTAVADDLRVGDCASGQDHGWNGGIGDGKIGGGTVGAGLRAGSFGDDVGSNNHAGLT